VIDKFVDVEKQFVDACRKFNFPNLIVIKLELESQSVHSYIFEC